MAKENRELKFLGMDASLETSLIEYGFVCTNEAKDCDNENEYFVIYRMNDGLFGTGYIEDSDLNNSLRELNGNPKTFSSCYNDKQDFYNDSFVNKLNNLMHYYGHENIIGCDYYPSYIEEIESLYPQIFE